MASHTRSAILLLAIATAPEAQRLSQDLLVWGHDVYFVAETSNLPDSIAQIQPDLLIMDAELFNTAHLADQINDADALQTMPIIALIAPDESPINHPVLAYANTAIRRAPHVEDLIPWINTLVANKRRVDLYIEENLRLAEHARRNDLMKADIISNVTHELRTPFVQVKAAVALLAEDIRATGNPDQTRLTNMATQAIERLGNAVENVNQLNQAHQIKIAPLIISEAINRAMRHLERNWSSAPLRDRVYTEVEPDLPPVWGDKSGLSRLLQLLLDNALKFSADDSPVRITARRCAPDQVQISVEDQGIGIAPDKIDHIFDAFYQVDASTTRRVGGTGVGLALANLLAEGMNTVIEVESHPGQGSTFSIRLPVVDLETL